MNPSTITRREAMFSRLKEITKGLSAKIVTPLTLELSARSKIDLICSCGQQVKLTIADINSGNSRPQCKQCTGALKSEKLHAPSREAIWGRLVDRATLFGAAFDKSSFKGTKSPIGFVCKCGESSTILVDNAFKENRRIECPNCSRAYKSSVTLRGTEHPKYNHDLDEAARVRRTFLRTQRERGFDWYTDWVYEVKRRSGFKCAISGLPSKHLTSHHIYNWAHFPNLRIYIDNGVCLHKELHDEFHAIYGKGRNTYSQFAEFFFNKTGRRFEALDLGELYADHP